jgi:hypothetical protein
MDIDGVVDTVWEKIHEKTYNCSLSRFFVQIMKFRSMEASKMSVTDYFENFNEQFIIIAMKISSFSIEQCPLKISSSLSYVFKAFKSSKWPGSDNFDALKRKTTPLYHL